MPLSAPRTEELRGYDGLEDAWADWERLADRANPFSAWEFAAAWWRHRGKGELRLRALRDKDETVALLPLYEAPDATWRLLGHHDADLLGPICPPALWERATRALVTAAAGARLELEAVPHGTAALLGAAATTTLASPVTDLPDEGFDALLGRLSANHRAQVRSRTRRLEREHAVTLRTADADTLEADLETLIALHHARWRGTTRVYVGVRADLNRDWARAALARGELRLRLLELDGTAVAANFALRAGAAEWYYQAGRDPAWDHRSVGAVLQARCIAAAIDEGAREYRWLRGDEAYKYRWPVRDEPVETVVVPAR